LLLRHSPLARSSNVEQLANGKARSLSFTFPNRCGAGFAYQSVRADGLHLKPLPAKADANSPNRIHAGDSPASRKTVARAIGQHPWKQGPQAAFGRESWDGKGGDWSDRGQMVRSKIQLGDASPPAAKLRGRHTNRDSTIRRSFFPFPGTRGWKVPQYAPSGGWIRSAAGTR